MKLRATTMLLGGAVVAAVAFGLVREERVTVDAPAGTSAVGQGGDPEGEGEPLGADEGAGGEGAGEPALAPSDLPAAIKWQAPSRWASAPNPSSLRIATYRVPHAAPDAEDGDLSVARAGGDVEANIERWLDQLGGGGRATRTERTVAGLRVHVVEADGTYAGMGAQPRTGWALLGAVVETPGEPYFFKLTGPARTVHAARADFDALLASITGA
jgi:hypothetical protein